MSYDAIASVRPPAGTWDEAGMTGSWSSAGTHLKTSICLTSRATCTEAGTTGPGRTDDNSLGQPASGYNFLGDDTVDLAITPGDFFRIESADVGGSEHGFIWGVRLSP